MGWTRGPVIGRGSSATVSLATSSTGEIFAVKSTNLTCSNSLQKEQYFLSQLSSPYIVKYIGCDITYENNITLYNLMMEHVAGGSLADLVKNQNSCALEESMIQVYIYQVLKGLQYLHSNGIVHCDIKGHNILISKNSAKIADLGCAKMVKESGNDSIISGTPLFMAPEVARGEDQDFPADIWALGCTILEIATNGAGPWPEFNDPVSVLYKIGYSSDSPSIPSWLSENAKDFLGKCFKRDKKERYTAEQLLKHPFFDGIVKSLVEDEKVVQNSPTSVLDQGFWDFTGAMQSSTSSSFSSSSSNSLEFPLENVVTFSPADRIKQLALSSDAEIPIWTEDENWITVGDFLLEENTQISLQNLDIVEDFGDDDDSILFSLFSEEFIESSILLEQDLLSSQFVDEINVSESNLDRINPTICLCSLEDELVSTTDDFERSNKDVCSQSNFAELILAPSLVCIMHG